MLYLSVSFPGPRGQPSFQGWFHLYLHRLELPLSATPPSNHRRWATDARLRHESELPNFGLLFSLVSAPRISSLKNLHCYHRCYLINTRNFIHIVLFQALTFSCASSALRRPCPTISTEAPKRRMRRLETSRLSWYAFHTHLRTCPSSTDVFVFTAR